MNSPGAMMRGARVTGPGKIDIVDLPVPTPGPGEALVRVMAYAPYGTDVGVYLNRDGRYVTDYPVGIGADFSGIVAAVGAGVANVSVGDRVSALSLEHCGVCANCQAGKTNICLDPAYLVVPRQSCCEEYTRVAARKLARLPDSVSFEDGAMLAGIVDALNAYEKMDLQAGDHLAVIGVGAMGLGAIATAVALGANVTAIGGTGARATLAATLGARHVISLAQHGEDVTAAALDLKPGGFSHIIETTATTWGLKQAGKIAAMSGAIAVTGGYDMGLTAWDLVIRELKLYGVRAGHHQEQALALIADGRIDLKPTVAACFALNETNKAFELLTGATASDVGRVMIKVGKDRE